VRDTDFPQSNVYSTALLLINFEHRYKSQCSPARVYITRTRYLTGSGYVKICPVGTRLHASGNGPKFCTGPSGLHGVADRRRVVHVSRPRASTMHGHCVHWRCRGNCAATCKDDATQRQR